MVRLSLKDLFTYFQVCTCSAHVYVRAPCMCLVLAEARGEMKPGTDVMEEHPVLVPAGPALQSSSSKI